LHLNAARAHRRKASPMAGAHCSYIDISFDAHGAGK
jgi:hypothetical protein